MPDETTGVMPFPETVTDEAAVSEMVSTTTNAAASNGVAHAETAHTQSGAETPVVDEMELEMQQMPPLDEIDVPGVKVGGDRTASATVVVEIAAGVAIVIRVVPAN